MALPKYIDEYTPPKSEPRHEGDSWCDAYNSYKPFNQQQKKDFYDLMTPRWSEQMAKQYNQDMKQDGVELMIQKATEGLVKDHINPAHYKGIVGNYQYIECMEFILGYDGLKAHLIGQIYKYMMRLGKKDSEQQELGKVIWYSKCLALLLRDGTIIGKLDELK